MSVIQASELNSYSTNNSYPTMNGTYSNQGYPTSTGQVKVDQLKPIVLGQVNSFRLDASESGKGTLDLSVGPVGKTIPHTVKDIGKQLFLIEFVPEEPVDHEVSVQFNDVHIPGSPYLLQAPYLDVSSVIVSGDGLVIAKVQQQAAFNINATRLPSSVKPVVSIHGPSGPVSANVIPTEQGSYRVSWTPSSAGDHDIRVTLAGKEVPRSPFHVRVADPKKVAVECPAYANLGTTANVTVDVSRAGLGKLVLVVSADGVNVPNTVHQDGPSLYRFSFKPTLARTHEVIVQFNGEMVPGSPFSCQVTGGSRNVILTDHQMVHFYGSPVEIEIDAKGAGEGQIVAEVRSEYGGVPSDLVPTQTKKVYLLTFYPKEGGDHTIMVTFNDEQVPQSPMKINVKGGPSPDNVYPNMQRTETLVYSQAPPPQPMQTMKETIFTQTSQLAQQPMLQAPVVYSQTSHMAAPNSPQPSPASSSNQYEQYSTLQKELSRTITYQPQYDAALVNEPTYFEINPHGASMKDVEIKLQDPFDKPVHMEIGRVGERYRYDFTPRLTGKYQIFVNVDGSPLPGSPFTYFVQPSSGVKVEDVTEEAEVGQEMYFIVDASAAGSGDLDVEVTCNGQLVRIKKEPLGNSRYRYTYIPKQSGEHLIDVFFNYIRVPGCPIRTFATSYRSLDRQGSSVYGVQTAGNDTITRVHSVSGRGIQSIPVSQLAYFFIDMHGKNWKLSDVEVDVQAPNGVSVPTKLYLEGPNEIRVEYKTPYVGKHLVDIYLKGQRIAGCPYVVEVFDPKKVGLESMDKETYLHEQTEFEVLDDDGVVNDEAGSAEMECRVVSPSGRIIPSHVVKTSRGMKVKYTPEEPGVYYVHTYIGGVEIPGSPMTQVVRSHTLGSRNSKGSHHEYRESRDVSSYKAEDMFGKITVSGEGLFRGEEDKPAHFYIDTHGMEGTPEVRVEGPHSMAKCTISPEGMYRYKVTYIPVETGIYNVYVKWMNQEIDGSPFHPRVVDARKVRAKGEWQTNMDSEKRINLRVNEMKRLMFDVTEAGPGELKAEVRHIASGRLIPVTVSHKDAYHCYVDFVPDQVGDYLISIYWTDTQIPNSPIRGYATAANVKIIGEAKAGTTASQGKSGKEFSTSTTKTVTKSGATASTDHSKVILSGTGLKEGIVGQLAEFYIDGSKATDGLPKVILKNSRLQQVRVDMIPVGDRTYKCSYLVNEPGAYMLFVSWGDRDLLNSPYTVMMKEAGDVSNGAMSSSANYHSSSYSTQQNSNVQPLRDQVDGQIIPIIQPDLQSGQISSQGQGQGHQQSSQQQSGQTGMSKHYSHLKRAKMTTSSNQQQNGNNLGENIQLMIDANMMSGGELVARCWGPNINAKCDLVHKEGGMYSLNVKPQEAGNHTLEVKYNGDHIEGSPYEFYVNGQMAPDPNKVRVRGPGIEHGILANYQSKFFVDTEGAGAGNLSIKMRGPKGSFQAAMKRISQSSRTIECTYNPTEVGLYIIHVKWSGIDVPGSPFHVHIFDTLYELDRFDRTGILPQEMQEHHLLQVKEPSQSYQTSAYQTNTLKTLRKSKKSGKEGLLVREPVFVQPVQPVYREVVKEVIREPEYVVRDAKDATYLVSGPGRPVAVVNGNSGTYQSYHKESHYSSGGGHSGGHGTYSRGKTGYLTQDPVHYVVHR